MTPHEKIQREIELLALSIKTLKESAEEEQRIYHTKHIDVKYRLAINLLEERLDGANAFLRRLAAADPLSH